MNNAEAVNWLINITADIGKIEHQDLWHYEQALSEIREMLEDAPTIEPCKDAVKREDVQSIAEKSDWFESSDSFNDFIWALYELPPAQPEQRWIPVDLRNNSPEENKVVLLGVRFQDDFKYFVTSRQDYNYWTGLGREIKGELRWQPLPEQYRAERKTDGQAVSE